MLGKGTGGYFLSSQEQSPSLPLSLHISQMLGASEGNAESHSIQGATHSDRKTETGEETTNREESEESEEDLIIKESAV
jgi:hypothetical protein